MKKKNRKRIQKLVSEEGFGNIIKYDGRFFWHESLVKKALNLMEEEGK